MKLNNVSISALASTVILIKLDAPLTEYDVVVVPEVVPNTTLLYSTVKVSII